MRALLRATALAWALTATAVVSAPAAATVLSVQVTGVVSFIDAARFGDMPESVVTSIRNRIPDGSAFDALLLIDDATPDANADPNIGDYQNAVTFSRFTVNGIDFNRISPFCNPSFDCKVNVQNDFLAVPAVGDSLDQVSVSSRLVSSDGLDAAVTADTGLTPTLNLMPPLLIDAPIASEFFLFLTGFGLTNDDSFINPANLPIGPSDEGSWSLFVPAVWSPSDLGPPTRINYRVSDLTVSQVPAPLSLPLLASALGLAFAGARLRDRKRRAA